MRSKKWRKGLHKMCNTCLNKNSVILEIGCASGCSTSIFAQHANTVYAVDPWTPCDLFAGAAFRPPNFKFTGKRCEKRFDLKVEKFPNIIKIKSKSNDVVNDFLNASLDLVYIDSIHTFKVVSECIKLWESKVKNNGYIAGHDYHKHWPQVMRAVNKYYGKPDQVFPDTSWVVKLTSRRRKTLLSRSLL